MNPFKLKNLKEQISNINKLMTEQRSGTPERSTSKQNAGAYDGVPFEDLEKINKDREGKVLAGDIYGELPPERDITPTSQDTWMTFTDPVTGRPTKTDTHVPSPSDTIDPWVTTFVTDEPRPDDIRVDEPTPEEPGVDFPITPVVECERTLPATGIHCQKCVFHLSQGFVPPVVANITGPNCECCESTGGGDDPVIDDTFSDDTLLPLNVVHPPCEDMAESYGGTVESHCIKCQSYTEEIESGSLSMNQLPDFYQEFCFNTNCCDSIGSDDEDDGIGEYDGPFYPSEPVVEEDPCDQLISFNITPVIGLADPFNAGSFLLLNNILSNVTITQFYNWLTTGDIGIETGPFITFGFENAPLFPPMQPPFPQTWPDVNSFLNAIFSNSISYNNTTNPQLTNPAGNFSINPNTGELEGCWSCLQTSPIPQPTNMGGIPIQPWYTNYMAGVSYNGSTNMFNFTDPTTGEEFDYETFINENLEAIVNCGETPPSVPVDTPTDVPAALPELPTDVNLPAQAWNPQWGSPTDENSEHNENWSWSEENKMFLPTNATPTTGLGSVLDREDDITAGGEDDRGSVLGGTTDDDRKYGCTDPDALNYDPIANYDDGSCEYAIGEPIPGCTDPTAINYNPNATFDDGSCMTIVMMCDMFNNLDPVAQQTVCEGCQPGGMYENNIVCECCESVIPEDPVVRCEMEGDLNGDGQIDELDAGLYMDLATGNLSPSSIPCPESYCDFSGVGDDQSNALTVLNWMIGNISELPPCGGISSSGDDPRGSYEQPMGKDTCCKKCKNGKFSDTCCDKEVGEKRCIYRTITDCQLKRKKSRGKCKPRRTKK